MVYNYAKLALISGFALMADAKKGKYGYRRDAKKDETDGIANEKDDEFVSDSFDAQTDSKFPEIDMMDKKLAKRLKQGKKNKNKKGNEKDFAKGVLASIEEMILANPEDSETISLDTLGEIFMAIMGEDFDPEDNRAFERGAKFGEKRLWNEAGCRAECRDAPFAEGCQSCCREYSHSVDWHCDSTDPENPPAKCCTEWSAECYTTNSEDNNMHACKACGYGYGRGYGYGGYSRGYGGYGRGYGRRRSSQGYGRRRSSQGYGRRRASAGYGRSG